ncbi:MAG: hypothetical protein OXI93_16540, partial [Bryobacterales bacterium]|nr:hypothetical protein [Bryobacterales bacterium]
ARAKRLAPRPDGPLTHFTTPRGETCRLVPPPPPLRGADHSSRKHPDRHPGRLISSLFHISRTPAP